MRYLILLTLLLAGCAVNPYKKYYKSLSEGDITLSPKVILSKDDPELLNGTNKDQDGTMMAENGYLLIGYSSFYSPEVRDYYAIQQAKAVKAEKVIVYKSYRNTSSGVVPLTLPTTTTSTTSFSGYGSNTGNFSGQAYTTNYGSQTTYIPYSNDIFDYGASYWVKGIPPDFGVHVKDISEEKRQELETNKGAEIQYVVRDSPAFDADLLRGDVIKDMGGNPINSAADFTDEVPRWAGKEVDVKIMRGQRVLTKPVKLRSFKAESRKPALKESEEK